MKLFKLRSPARKTGLALAAGLLAVACSTFPQPLNTASPFSLNTTAQAQSTSQPNWATIEQNLITEHNRVRQNPQSYVPILEAHLASMNAQGNIPNGCGRNCTLLTNEGKPAVEEAIQFLRRQPAVGALTLSAGATQAAQAHAKDQSNGTTGHTGSDGSRPHERLARFGVQNLGSGENIAYGPATAQQVMLNLIVDDGVRDRGHRTNIFSPNWTMAGAGCGPHQGYGNVCVIEYAKGAGAAN
ncbi:MAG: CAP domain-containing protein [Phormidesmis sp.]